MHKNLEQIPHILNHFVLIICLSFIFSSFPLTHIIHYTQCFVRSSDWKKNHILPHISCLSFCISCIALCINRIPRCISRISHSISRISLCISRIPQCISRISLCISHISLNVSAVYHSVSAVYFLRIRCIPVICGRPSVTQFHHSAPPPTPHESRRLHFMLQTFLPLHTRYTLAHNVPSNGIRWYSIHTQTVHHLNSIRHDLCFVLHLHLHRLIFCSTVVYKSSPYSYSCHILYIFIH